MFAQVDEGGNILVLPGGGFPWKEHLFQLEDKGTIPKYQVSFVIYKHSRLGLGYEELSSDANTSDTWKVQVVHINSESSIARQVFHITPL